MKVMNGMRGNRQLTSDHEVLAAIRARGLDYPVATKADFVAAMCCPATPVGFRGRVYVLDSAPASSPISSFRCGRSRTFLTSSRSC